jgi:hypothetical protein
MVMVTYRPAQPGLLLNVGAGIQISRVARLFFGTLFPRLPNRIDATQKTIISSTKSVAY